MTRRILLDSDDQFVIMRGKAGIGCSGKQNFSISHKGLLNIGHLLPCNISRFLLRSFAEPDTCSQYSKLQNIVRCPVEVCLNDNSPGFAVLLKHILENAYGRTCVTSPFSIYPPTG